MGELLPGLTIFIISFRLLDFRCPGTNAPMQLIMSKLSAIERYTVSSAGLKAESMMSPK